MELIILLQFYKVVLLAKVMYLQDALQFLHQKK